jgi:hypothetical protein
MDATALLGEHFYHECTVWTTFKTAVQNVSPYIQPQIVLQAYVRLAFMHASMCVHLSLFHDKLRLMGTVPKAVEANRSSHNSDVCATFVFALAQQCVSSDFALVWSKSMMTKENT